MLPQYWDEYDTIWAPATKEKKLGRASGGLVFAARKCVGGVEILNVDYWWIFARVTVEGGQMVVGDVYFPPPPPGARSGCGTRAVTGCYE